ncbi:unnamed protein product [Peronospora belbahrii]|uniref:Uncharacterized protein n=1 Tax=Peronospora belbahrii TaxID=622444 RepID=A0ABN8D1C8_9STRA|nr:unnamed protein product [Peronospora belbahrii]
MRCQLYRSTVLSRKNNKLHATNKVSETTLLMAFCTRIIQSTPLSQGSDETCGMNLLVSYVANDGNLELLDKSCVDKMPAFNLTLSLEDQYSFMSTEDAYDGVYNESLAA